MARSGTIHLNSFAESSRDIREEYEWRMRSRLGPDDDDDDDDDGDDSALDSEFDDGSDIEN